MSLTTSPTIPGPRSLTAFGLCLVALSPRTWRTSTRKQESDGWTSLGNLLVTSITHTPGRQTSLLEKDLRPNQPQILTEPHTYCTKALGRWGGQGGFLPVVPSKDLLPFTPSFWTGAFSLAGEGYTTLLIRVSFWSLLLSQEGQSTVQLMLSPPWSPWYCLIFLSHLFTNTPGHSLELHWIAAC